MKRSHLKLLTLLVPAFFFVFFIWQADANKNNGTIWTIPISGYDPRDLISGHYLQFTYDWNWRPDSEESCVGEECCLCLSKNGEENNNPFVSSLTCEKAKEPNTCDSFIKGTVYLDFTRQRQFMTGNQASRFYVPEEYAYQLDEMIAKPDHEHEFEIGLNVTKDGRAFINSMTVDAQDFWAWIRNQND